MNQDGNFGISRRPSFFVPQETSYLETQTPPRSKKRKLFFVIIIIIAIVAVIFAAIAFLSWSSLEAKNLREAVNLFGNYLLTGTESTDDLPESMVNNDYTSYRIGYVDSSDDKEEKKNYYSRLSKYYESVKKYYEQDSSKFESDISVKEAVSYLGNAVSFLEMVDDADSKTDIDIYSYLWNNGNESAKRYINNIFGEYTNTDNTVINSYFKTKKDAVTEMRKLAKAVYDAGCSSDENKESCMINADKDLYGEAQKIRDGIFRKKAAFTFYRSNTIDLLISNTLNIASKVRQAEGAK